ncbi:hypothetical protein SRABI26_04415 [Arthrobacter sp. Bi26]|nr:hypothetical protein SRABI26_04415 [Arthrobacter sp. Bi26]
MRGVAVNHAGEFHRAGGRAEELLQPVPALTQRQAAQVLAGVEEQIEQHQPHRRRLLRPGDVGGLAEFHPALQQAEVRPAGAPDGDDLAVGDEALFRPTGPVREFGVAHGHVDAVPADEPDSGGVADDQGPHAVPFELVLPVQVRQVRQGPGRGQHRTEPGGVGGRFGAGAGVRSVVALDFALDVAAAAVVGVVRCAGRAPRAGVAFGRARRVHQVDEPLVVGLTGVDQGEPAGPAKAAALRSGQGGDDLLAGDPLFAFVVSAVPDADRPGAVLALGNVTFEVGVVHRVVFGLDREVVLGLAGRDALGQCPGHQHPVAFEPEVVVKPPGVVLLDDEFLLPCPAVVPGLVPFRREGLWRACPVPFGAVLVQPRVGVAAVAGLLGRCLGPSSGWVFRRVGRGGSAVVPAAGDGSERILAGGDAFHYLLEVQVVQRGGSEFPPRARCGHRRPGPAAQRVRHDGGLGGVVLAPVHEHPAGAQGLLHVADGQIRVVCFERAGQFVGEIGNLVRALGSVQGGVEVDALAAARYGHGI